MNANKFVAIPGSEPKLGKRTSTGPVSPKEKISVSILLRKNPLIRENTVSSEDLGNQLPRDKNYLTQTELEIMNSASREDIKKIKNFALKYGLKTANVHLEARMVTLNGTVEKLSKAFQIKFEKFMHKNHEFRSHKGQIQIPADLENIIEGVYGLDNQNAISPRFAKLKSNEKTSYPPEKRYSPLEVAKAYNFPEGATGKGQSIAIIALEGGYKKNDITYYLKKVAKVKVPKIINVFVDGAKNKPGYGECEMEVTMDLEIIAAIANRAKIVVYFAPNTEQGFFNAVSLAVFDKKHKNSIISISWGRAECDWSESMLKSVNDLFHTASLKGITICVASGDEGADDGIDDGKAHVDFPASSPYVLGCGGTILTIKGGKRKKEVVWNEEGYGNKWATGGGVSSVFPVPSYQKELGTSIKSVNPGKKTGRYVPDIAAIAGSPGYNIYMNKLPTERPGAATSASAPLWAALIALINEKVGKPVGYINPLLYKSSRRNRLHQKLALFNDITLGNNDLDKLGGYKAEHGWDACTGLGSPNGEELLKLFRGEIP